MSSYSNEHVANKNFSRLETKVAQAIEAINTLLDPVNRVDPLSVLAPLIECDSVLGECVTDDDHEDITEVCAEVVRSLMRRDERILCLIREQNKQVGNICGEVAALIEGNCCGDLGSEGIVCSMNPILWCRSGEGLVLAEIDNDYVERWLDKGSCDCPRAKFTGGDTLVSFGNVAAWNTTAVPIDVALSFTVGDIDTDRVILSLQTSKTGLEYGGVELFLDSNNDLYLNSYETGTTPNAILLGNYADVDQALHIHIDVNISTVVTINGTEVHNGNAIDPQTTGTPATFLGTDANGNNGHTGMIWNVNIDVNATGYHTYVGSGNYIEDWQDIGVGGINPIVVRSLDRYVPSGEGFRPENSLDAPTKYVTREMPLLGIDRVGRVCPIFDGEDDFLECLTDFKVEQPNLVGLVFRPEAVINETSVIVDGLDGYQHMIGYQQDGKLFYQNSGKALTDEGVQVNEWFVVVGVFAGDSSKLLVNGVIVHEEDTGDIGLKELIIGASAGSSMGYFMHFFAGLGESSQNFFAGTIAEVCVIHNPYDIEDGAQELSNYLIQRHIDPASVGYLKTTTDGFVFQTDGTSRYLVTGLES